MKAEQNPVVGADSEEITQHIDNLKHKSGSTRENAAQSLASLASDSATNRDAIREAGGISLLVGLVSDTQPAPVRQEAVRALANLACDNVANQNAIRELKGIPPLVGLLTDAASDMCRYAVRALSNLVAGNASNQDEVYGGGATAPLLALLEDATAGVRAEATRVLASIASRSSSIRTAMGTAGAIAPLVVLLDDAQPDAVCLGAVQALANLANEANQGIIREKGGIPALVNLLVDDVSDVRANAARALGNLSKKNAANQDAIREENGINSLLKLLGDEHSIVRQQVAGAIANMVADNATNKAAIRSAGGITRLVVCLSDAAVCMQAIRVLYELSKNNDTVNQDAIREVGGIVPLIGLLSDADPVICQRVMSAIVAIVGDNAANKMVVCAAGGVIPLVACLNDVDPAVCLEAIRVFCELSENSDAVTRDAIREAGGISSLITLLGDKNPRMRELAAHVLAWLGVDPINQDAICEADGLPSLVTLLLSDAKSESEVSDEAKSALINIVRDNVKNLGILVSLLVGSFRDVKRAVLARVMGMLRGFALDSSTTVAFREVGGITLLLDLVSSGIKTHSNVSGRVKDILSLLVGFCRDANNQDAVLPSLLSLLRDARPEIREHVEEALYFITARGGVGYKEWEKSFLDKARKTVVSSLLKLFTDGQASVRGQGAQSLVALIKRPQRAENRLLKKAFCEAGGMTILVRLLDSSQPAAIREQTAAAFCVFVFPHGDVVREAGAIVSLVRLLEDAESAVRKQAACTLVKFLKNSNAGKKEAIDNHAANKEAICTAGGIACFVTLLSDLDSGTRKHATSAIASLADDATNQETICTVGGIVPLLALLHDENFEVCEFSVRVLARLAHNNQAAIREADGIVPLVSLVDSVTSSLCPCSADRMSGKDHADNRVLRDAARALANLADNNVANQEAIREAGGFVSLGILLAADVVVDLDCEHLSCTSSSMAVGEVLDMRVAVVRALAKLVHKNTANQDAICAMGGVALMVKLLALLEQPQEPNYTKASHQFNQKHSLRRFPGGISLWNPREAMAHRGELRRAYVKEFGRVNTRRSWQALECREAIRVLLNLSTNTTGQAAIYSAGGIDSLVKLFGDDALLKLLGDDTLAVRQEATQMLANLANGDAANRAAICAAGGIPLLVTSLVNTDLVVLHATRAIAALAGDNNPVIQVAIHKAGGISSLVKLFDNKDSAVRQYAVTAVSNLANQPANQEVIRSAEGIPHLVKLLDDGSAVSKQAGRALDKLGYIEHRNSKVAGSGKKPPAAVSIPSEDLICEAAGLLGEGSYGEVYKGSWKGTEVVIKQLKAQAMADHAVAQLREEATIAMGFKHPNLILLHGFCHEPGHYGLVMKYMPRGSLYEMIHNQEMKLEWPERLRISLGIAEGLKCLHEASVVHGNLKSSNVMLDEGNVPVITDAGFFKVKAVGSMISGESGVDALRWAAPELLEPVTRHTNESDIYSFAMVLWELAARRLPWSQTYFPQLIAFWVVIQEKREEIPVETPRRFVDLIERCWAQRADERPEVADVVRNLEVCQGVTL